MLSTIGVLPPSVQSIAISQARDAGNPDEQKRRFLDAEQGMTTRADALNPKGLQFSGQIGRNNLRRSTCLSPCQRNWRQCEYSLVFAKSERDTFFGIATFNEQD